MKKIEMPQDDFEMDALRSAVEKYREKQLNDEIRELLLVEGSNGLAEIYEQELEKMEKEAEIAKIVLYLFFIACIVYAVYLTYEAFVLEQKVRQVIK